MLLRRPIYKADEVDPPSAIKIDQVQLNRQDVTSARERMRGKCV